MSNALSANALVPINNAAESVTVNLDDFVIDLSLSGGLSNGGGRRNSQFHIDLHMRTGGLGTLLRPLLKTIDHSPMMNQMKYFQ